MAIHVNIAVQGASNVLKSSPKVVAFRLDYALVHIQNHKKNVQNTKNWKNLLKNSKKYRTLN